MQSQFHQIITFAGFFLLGILSSYGQQTLELNTISIEQATDYQIFFFNEDIKGINEISSSSILHLQNQMLHHSTGSNINEFDFFLAYAIGKVVFWSTAIVGAAYLIQLALNAETAFYVYVTVPLLIGAVIGDVKAIIDLAQYSTKTPF